MATRIRKGTRGHLYLTEWFDHFDVNDEKVANRLDPPVARETVWKWRKEQHRLRPDKIAAIADALGIKDTDLYSPPPPKGEELPASVDDLLRGAPADLRATVVDMVKRLVSKAG